MKRERERERERELGLQFFAWKRRISFILVTTLLESSLFRNLFRLYEKLVPLVHKKRTSCFVWKFCAFKHTITPNIDVLKKKKKKKKWGR